MDLFYTGECLFRIDDTARADRFSVIIKLSFLMNIVQQLACLEFAEMERFTWLHNYTHQLL